MDEVDLVIDVSPTLRALSKSSESFGVISQSRKHNELELGVKKKEQAQILLSSGNELLNITFSLKATFNLIIGEYGIEITGCTILPGGLLVFADQSFGYI